MEAEAQGKNDSIDYDNLTYGDIFSAIKKLGINMCNDEKLLKYHLQTKKKAKYEMGNFCEQYGSPPIAPSRQKGKKHKKKVTKIIAIKNIKNTKIILSNLMIFMLKRKMFQKNMINKAQVKVNILTVENLVILVKIAIRNLVS